MLCQTKVWDPSGRNTLLLENHLWEDPVAGSTSAECHTCVHGKVDVTCIIIE